MRQHNKEGIKDRVVVASNALNLKKWNFQKMEMHLMELLSDIKKVSSSDKITYLLI